MAKTIKWEVIGERILVGRIEADRVIAENLIQLLQHNMFTREEESSDLPVILDFSDVTHMAAAFLGTLITMNKRVTKQKDPPDRPFILTGVSEDIMFMFRQTKLDKLFRIEATVDEAVASLN